MSAKNNKPSATGVRYTDAQKKEIVNFVLQHNSANGRGGQSAAAKKFNVTPLTISAWLKSAGAAKSAKKAAKAAKPAKAAKTDNSKKGVRYTAEQKREVVDFVRAHNAAQGRGGQSQAAKRFNLSVLTVSSWLKAAGVKGGNAVVSTKAAPAGLTAKVASFIALGDQVRRAEAELASLRARFDSLKEAIRASI
jgi:transposase-like protein